MHAPLTTAQIAFFLQWPQKWYPSWRNIRSQRQWLSLWRSGRHKTYCVRSWQDLSKSLNLKTPSICDIVKIDVTSKNARIQGRWYWFCGQKGNGWLSWLVGWTKNGLPHGMLGISDEDDILTDWEVSIKLQSCSFHFVLSAINYFE